MQIQIFLAKSNLGLGGGGGGGGGGSFATGKFTLGQSAFSKDCPGFQPTPTGKVLYPCFNTASQPHQLSSPKHILVGYTHGVFTHEGRDNNRGDCRCLSKYSTCLKLLRVSISTLVLATDLLLSRCQSSQTQKPGSVVAVFPNFLYRISHKGPPRPPTHTDALPQRHHPQEYF